MGTYAKYSTGSSLSGANQALSNLTSPTSINQNLLFSSDGVETIGDSAGTARPADIYVKDFIGIGTNPTLINQFYTPGSNALSDSTNLVGFISVSDAVNGTLAAQMGFYDQSTGNVMVWGKTVGVNSLTLGNLTDSNGGHLIELTNTFGQNLDITWSNTGAGNIGTTGHRPNTVNALTSMRVPSMIVEASEGSANAVTLTAATVTSGYSLALPVAQSQGPLVNNGSGTLSFAATATATLVAGTVTIANSAVTANSVIILNSQTSGGTQGSLYVSSITNGTGFTVKSTSSTDTSTIRYKIL
jgi:hypothetical protein